MPINVLIVDDSPRFLESARALLEREGFSVVGVASTAATGISEYERLHPDVVLVDIMLGEDSGFDVARRLADLGSGQAPVVVILISTEHEGDFADLIAASAAIGFVPKANLSGAAIRRLLADRSG
jgi:DNA-binding NarL/FixJ family response regulator